MKVKWSQFLFDVLVCALGSYGGPEAHYGVFSQMLVKKRGYITEEILTEMIGVYALVPGPSSTQTITAIGYYMGGKILALLTFLVWAMPAIFIMALIGVFFTFIDANDSWQPVLKYLPAAAVAFIIFAAWTLSKKVLKSKIDLIFYVVMTLLALLIVGFSVWIVPILLVLGGIIYFMPHKNQKSNIPITAKPKWIILAAVIILAIINEFLFYTLDIPWVTIFASFYRYGYSVIGGGQIVIPLMITDLVQNQALITLSDFLSGYAIDQAIPGPLFSFAAFVSARSFVGTGFSLFAGLLGGLSIFLPGILLVFFIFPLWQSMRALPQMKYFLKGVGITAASLILMTAIRQTIALDQNFVVYGVVLISTLLLLSKKIPAPLIIVLAAIAGFFI